jgi:hypothetical protein
VTVDQLIEALEEYRDMLGGDAEVRLMTQHNWPLEYKIHGITSGMDINEQDDDQGDVEDDGVVYIVEGSQIGYGTKRAWEVSQR